jgi:O-antigen ligase
MRLLHGGSITDWLQIHWSDAGAFLLFSLAFVLPSGYSYGAVVLLIGALLTFRRNLAVDLSWGVWFIVLSFFAYAAFWGLDGLVRGEGIRDLDRPVRFLVAAFVLLALCRKPPSSLSIMVGIALGGLGAGLVAGYEYYALNAGRAHGFMPTNSFGMLAALYTGWSVLILQTLRFKAGWWWVSSLSAAGAACAGLAAMFSGSRGAWLVLVGIAAILTVSELLRARRWVPRLLIVATPLVLFTAAYLAPGIPVQSRVNNAYTATIEYFTEGERIGGSIPARLDMWSGALKLFAEKPIIGWGERGYREGMAALFESGEIGGDPLSRRHLHNQFLHVAATKGVFGLVLLLSVLATPLVYTAGATNMCSASTKTSRTGVLPDYGQFLWILLGAFVIGGATRVPFEHHSGVMVFAFRS